MSLSNHTDRAVYFTAARDLNTSGYQSIRVSGIVGSRPYDLIAWNRDRILFLVIRHSKSGISAYTDIITRLAETIRTHRVPGEIQFWIARPGTWLKYQILPGGALPIPQRSSSTEAYHG